MVPDPFENPYTTFFLSLKGTCELFQPVERDVLITLYNEIPNSCPNGGLAGYSVVK